MNSWLLLSLCLVVAASPLFEVQNVDVSEASTYDKPVLVQIPSNADSIDLVRALEPHGLVPVSSDDVPERQVVLMPYGKSLERADFLDFVFPSLSALLSLLLSSVFKLPWLLLSAFNQDSSNSTTTASSRAERSLPFDGEPTPENPDAFPLSYEIDDPPSFVRSTRLLGASPCSDTGDHPSENKIPNRDFKNDDHT